MDMSLPYKTITREQFLFHEMRTTARLISSGLNDKEVMEEINTNNLFQYPTERMVKNLASVCIRRLKSMESEDLVNLIADGSVMTAKQVCLYAMMTSNRLVWEFMVTVIADKFRSKDFFYSKRDMNGFFSRLQEQNDEVASWSEGSIHKCKSVLNRILIETEYLDSAKSEALNPVLIDQELKVILIEKRDNACLAAFNCFEEA